MAQNAGPKWAAMSAFSCHFKSLDYNWKSDADNVAFWHRPIFRANRKGKCDLYCQHTSMFYLYLNSSANILPRNNTGLSSWVCSSPGFNWWTLVIEAILEPTFCNVYSWHCWWLVDCCQRTASSFATIAIISGATFQVCHYFCIYVTYRRCLFFCFSDMPRRQLYVHCVSFRVIF